MKNTLEIKELTAIVGPTASGKTDFAVKMAEEISGEVVSADSRLVYRDFNIGTAKPTLSEMRNIPHHLIDVACPTETYTVGRYKREADAAIKDILARGKHPIVAGGTGFYIKSLLQGLDIPKVEPDFQLRQELKALPKEELYRRLRAVDPIMAEKLHFNDVFRITRALEVYHITGIPMSEAQSISNPEYRVRYIGLNIRDRSVLYGRIDQRVLEMIEKGLVKEVEGLINGYGRTVSLLKTLGYREICEYLDDLCTLDEAIAKIQKNTRNYAKRQLTWFRANKQIQWIY